MYPYRIDNGTSLGVFYVMKDGATSIYTRQVQKIFVVFSFMGGLIGAIMAGMFIVNSYTSFSYEIALAIHVFKDNK
jgi:predicted membrane protein